jgi:hypothetical protein
MYDKRVYLKVKIKSLAAEARIIRKEEKKATGRLREGLTEHRRGIVRSEARHSLLAYGFIRGKKRSDIEPSSEKEIDKAKVHAMIAKYGTCWDYDNEHHNAYSARKKKASEAAEEWLK